jgi:hypothetical protein
MKGNIFYFELFLILHTVPQITGIPERVDNFQRLISDSGDR